MTLMFGSDFVKFFGVGADWLLGNLWRRVRGKSCRTWKRIWNGNPTNLKDDADYWGYDLFYIILGFFAMAAFIAVIGWLTSGLHFF